MAYFVCLFYFPTHTYSIDLNLGNKKNVNTLPLHIKLGGKKLFWIQFRSKIIMDPFDIWKTWNNFENPKEEFSSFFHYSKQIFFVELFCSKLKTNKILSNSQRNRTSVIRRIPNPLRDNMSRILLIICLVFASHIDANRFPGKRNTN